MMNNEKREENRKNWKAERRKGIEEKKITRETGRPSSPYVEPFLEVHLRYGGIRKKSAVTFFLI